MMYKGPIELIISEMHTKLVEEKERRILKGVQNIGINVDKDELIKALAYDRGQYEKGYADRDKELVRCKDCTHWDKLNYEAPRQGWCNQFEDWTDEDEFCSRCARMRGERNVER